MLVGHEQTLHHSALVFITQKQQKKEFHSQTRFKRAVNIGMSTGAKVELLPVHLVHHFLTEIIELLVNFVVVLRIVQTI
jgi:hypothetical protein